MDSGAEKHAPAGGDEIGQDDNNIVNEQPIEISSDSSNGGESEGSEPDFESDSDISIINSVSDSSESHNDERLEDEFSTIMAMPFKEYKMYMQLCHTAFKLNVFDKIDVAINEFEKYSTIPSHIWLRYLKTLKVVTQTPAEQATFQSKSHLALSSYYDDQLAEFIVKGLEEQPLFEHEQMWCKLLTDYGLERIDFLEKLRAQLSALEDKDEVARIEKTLSAECVTWNCTDDQLQEIDQIIEEFKQKLKNSTENSSWLQEMFLLRIDTLMLDRIIKVSLGKLIYERCLAKFPSDSSLWLDYIAYMQKPVEPQGNDSTAKQQHHMLVHDGHLKSKPMDLIKRALQSKPSVKLNHKYLQLMELNNYSVEKIDEELGQHFNRIERYMEMSVELQLDYLAYRVRNTNVEQEDQVNALRTAFHQVWARLSQQYGELADTGYEVLQLYALVEYAQLKCPSNGADIWAEILSYPGSSEKSHLWLAYAQMESEYNGGRKMRTVLQQALMALPADVEGVTDLYRRYERCFGNYDTIGDCQTYCEQIQESTFVPGRQRPTTFAQGRRQQTPFHSKPAKKHLTTLPKKPQQSMPKEKTQMPPAAKKNTTLKRSAPDSEPRAPNFKYSPHLEANKVFIRNLHAECTKEELVQAFQGYGVIKDVRLVYKHNKTFKGIAYIEYELPEQALKAVAGADGLDIAGQKISVAISNPPPKGAAAVGTTAAAGGRGGVGAAAAAAVPRQAEKRRIPTSLIPTKLVMLEVKRRKKLELDEETETTGTSDANGKSSDAANGQQAHNETAKEAGGATGAEEAAAATAAPTVPKSNDDFRKLFNI